NEVVGESGKAKDDKIGAGETLDAGDEGAIAFEELQEGPERDRREEKGSAEAGRVGDEQPETARDRVGSAGERQDRPEDRPHARRPTDREGEPDDERADATRRLLAELELSCAAQEADAEQARDGEPEQDDEQATDPPD